MRKVWHKLFRVTKTKFADIEALSLPADEIFRVERRIPWLDLEVSQDDI